MFRVVSHSTLVHPFKSIFRQPSQVDEWVMYKGCPQFLSSSMISSIPTDSIITSLPMTHKLPSPIWALWGELQTHSYWYFCTENTYPESLAYWTSPSTKYPRLILSSTGPKGKFINCSPPKIWFSSWFPHFNKCQHDSHSCQCWKILNSLIIPSSFVNSS